MKVIIKNLTRNDLATELSVEEISQLHLNITKFKADTEAFDKAWQEFHWLPKRKQAGKQPTLVKPDHLKVGEYKIAANLINSSHELNYVKVVDFNLENYNPDFKSKNPELKFTYYDRQISSSRFSPKFLFVKNVETIGSEIKAYLHKYLDSIEMHTERLEAWKTGFLAAEAKGVEALEQYKANNPRPMKLTEEFYIQDCKLNVELLLRNKPVRMENLLMDLYAGFDFHQMPRRMMLGHFEGVRTRHRIQQFEQELKQNDIHVSESMDVDKKSLENQNYAFKKIESEQFDRMRKELSELKLNFLNESQFLDEIYKVLNTNFSNCFVREVSNVISETV